MSARHVVAAGVLGALAEITLLGVFVFVDEPQRMGHPIPHLHAVDAAYFAVPFLLFAAAAATLLAALRKDREREET